MSNAIFSAKLTPAQNAACEKLLAVSGLPPVGLDELDRGLLSPSNFWRQNVMIAHDIYAAVQNIDFPEGDQE